MRHSCSQSESAGRQALASTPGAGPSPVTTPLCIRREKSSLLHIWEKASPACWPHFTTMGGFEPVHPMHAEHPSRSTGWSLISNNLYTVSATTVWLWLSVAAPEGLFTLKEDLTLKTEVWAGLCSQQWGTGTPKHCPDLSSGRWGKMLLLVFKTLFSLLPNSFR